MPGQTLGLPQRALLLSLLLVALLAGSSQPEELPAPVDGQVRYQRLKQLSTLPGGLRPPRLKQSQVAALSGQAAPDSLHVLVVGVDFSDSLLWGRDLAEFPGWPEQRRTGTRIPTLPPEITVYQFDAHDAEFFDVQMGVVRDYFSTVSRGRFALTWDIHPDLINLPRAMGYYGLDDSSTVRGVDLAVDAVAAIDAAVDFSSQNYDSIVLIHAGAGQETDILGDSPEQLFSSYIDVRDFEEGVEAGRLESPWIPTDDGARIEHVLVLPESEAQDPFGGGNGSFGSTGVYCFILGLRLGMLNLADFTPAGRPDSQGIGEFGLMAFGLFTGGGLVPAQPCAFNRQLMGWVDPVLIAEDADIRLPAIASGVGDTLLVKVPIDSREYWLVEYRLQDPNGDLFFSFDDANGNRFPDYFDADSDNGDGTPTSPFDPATDTWESTLGAEWDYFMSENPARESALQNGGGSGLYIWHIDEGVIAQTILEGVTTVNADPDHKGVDLEEADGIQDLDSPQGSPYVLGWDQDNFRGEGANRFGPDTLPPTDTADGVATGISIQNISTVSTDTLEVETGRGVEIVYRDAMTFELRFGDPGQGAQLAQRALFDALSPRYDVRLVDLGAGPASPTPDGSEEIVTAGDGGAVYAFRGDLSEWIDGDGIASTTGVLAIAMGLLGEPEWIGAPVVGDVDADGTLDVILASANGIFAFSSSTGRELFDGDGDDYTVGLIWQGSVLQPPTLVERPGQPPLIAVVHALPPGQGEGFEVSVLEVSTSTVATSLATQLGQALTPVVTADPALVVGFQSDGSWLLTIGSVTDRKPLDGTLVGNSLLAFDFGAADLAWVDSTGAVRAEDAPVVAGGFLPKTEPSEPPPLVSSPQPGPWSAIVGAAERPDGPPVLAYAAGHDLFLLDRGLRPFTGSPYRPGYVGEVVRGPDVASAPLLVDVTGNGDAEVLWHDAVGRLHAVSVQGTSLSGWPVAGPAQPDGSPAVGDVDGDGFLELVALGTFAAVEDVNAPGRVVTTRNVGELRVYDLEAPASAYAPWRQGRHDAAGSGLQNVAAADGGVATSGTLFEPGTASVRPSPASGSSVNARVFVRRLTGTVRVAIYNLEGEEVASVARFVAAGSWFDEEISIAHLASGYYVCRFQADEDEQFETFVVVR